MIIGVCGASSSGKSTISAYLQEILQQEKNKSVLSIAQDNYYKPDHVVPKRDGSPDYDNPESIYLDKLAANLRALMGGQAVCLPQYNKLTKEITRTKPTWLTEIGVVEGIYIYQTSQLRELITKKIFLDIDEKTMRERRLARSDGQDDEEFFEKIVLPGYQLVKQQKQYADIVIDARAPLEHVQEEVRTTIESFLNGNL